VFGVSLVVELCLLVVEVFVLVDVVEVGIEKVCYLVVGGFLLC